MISDEYVSLFNFQSSPKKGKGSAKKPVKPSLTKKKSAKNGHSGGRKSSGGGRGGYKMSYAEVR